MTDGHCAVSFLEPQSVCRAEARGEAEVRTRRHLPYNRRMAVVRVEGPILLTNPFYELPETAMSRTSRSTGRRSQNRVFSLERGARPETRPNMADIRSVGQGDHICVYYDSDGQRSSMVAEYLKIGTTDSRASALSVTCRGFSKARLARTAYSSTKR
jgi:hypothetical protein